MLVVAAVAATLIGCLILALVAQSKGRGKAEAIQESQKEVLNEVAEANTIRDRLLTDPDYAKRVRDRFTRSEE